MKRKILYFILVWLFRAPFIVLFLYTLPFPQEGGISNLPIALCSLIFVVVGPYEFYKIFHSKFADVTSVSVMGMVIALDQEKKEIQKQIDSKVPEEEGNRLAVRLKRVEEDLDLYKKLSDAGVQEVVPKNENLVERISRMQDASFSAARILATKGMVSSNINEIIARAKEIDKNK
ncbi:MAG: hypothetical protein WC369_00220 [Dehalococcoidales bacterium]|jgi:hypothetical protein